MVGMGDILLNDPIIAQTAVAAARKCGKDQAQQLRLVEVLTRDRAKEAAAAAAAST